MLQSLIIGFGRAGRGLHYPCLQKAQKSESYSDLFHPYIGVVDPRIAETNIEQPNLQVFSQLDQVAGFDPSSTVVHICTPPELHSETLHQAAALGYRMIVMEKPLTTSLRELQTIHELQNLYQFELLVVANWLSSVLTTALSGLLQTGDYGPLRFLEAEQNKPRLSRTLANPSHGNAFDVEIPHLVALALALGGTDSEIIDAEIADMCIGNRVIPRMGYASMTLMHAGGLTSQLSSNLSSPIRKRCIRLHFDRHFVTGYYPSGSDDSYSWLQIHSVDGRLLDERIIEDDPLTAVFTDFYSFFDGRAKKPVSDLDFNDRVVSTIYEAKEKCGLLLPKQETTGVHNILNMAKMR
ncbi:Gfo/Idh/MocA family oxidoreductase [Paenibacillus sp. sptzw28]|uniref:Gfo/Idh/MocA family oxidoreductase n=1 Tax=Paenibacillus sp. sptzw28 TaxID=715179 RepID=UPI001C6F4B19|nr:Gfo/Idh/MocA family oxidoreductase [Paenibacillus sp. sptzw28]QYR23482.1 Gfo/Idh/MocA family oxidoreductase [Paenibacillus sp. sptzw28]